MREHDLAEFELERDGLKVRVRKAGREVAVAPARRCRSRRRAAPAAPVAAVPRRRRGGAGAEPAEPAEGVDLAVIKSPIVGTFYRASEPGAPPFVEVGDHGQARARCSASSKR